MEQRSLERPCGNSFWFLREKTGNGVLTLQKETKVVPVNEYQSLPFNRSSFPCDILPHPFDATEFSEDVIQKKIVQSRCLFEDNSRRS
jgi:hypothetical protein